MVELSYDEQAIIKGYRFSSKEELKQKITKGIQYFLDDDVKEIARNLIPKIDKFDLEDLQDLDAYYE